MTTVAIIQARAGSTRLPGKVLADLAGEPMLVRVIERAAACGNVDDVVVATTTRPEDDAVAAVAAAEGVPVFRGSADDVLARYHDAARWSAADVVVRLTADCPLLDPLVIGVVIDALGDADYASNTHTRTFPRGLDVEAFPFDTLARLHRTAHSAAAREHVTAGILEARGHYTVHQVLAARDDGDLRLTVDTAADLALVRAIYRELGPATTAYGAVVELLRARPELVALNAHVRQKPVDPRPEAAHA